MLRYNNGDLIVQYFYCRSNSILNNSNLLKCTDIRKLHHAFCMNIYRELLDLSNKCMNNIYVAHRKVIRRVFKLPFHTHNFIINGMYDDSLEVRLHTKTVRFIYNLLNNNNPAICNVMMYFIFNNNSVLSENFKFLCYRHNMNICDGYGNISAIMNAISCFFMQTKYLVLN